jgi:hypothetical protein
MEPPKKPRNLYGGSAVLTREIQLISANSVQMGTSSEEHPKMALKAGTRCWFRHPMESSHGGRTLAENTLPSLEGACLLSISAHPFFYVSWESVEAWHQEGEWPRRLLLIANPELGIGMSRIVFEDDGFECTIATPKQSLQIAHNHFSVIVVCLHYVKQYVRGEDGFSAIDTFVSKLRMAAGAGPVIMLQGWRALLGSAGRVPGSDAFFESLIPTQATTDAIKARVTIASDKMMVPSLKKENVIWREAAQRHHDYFVQAYRQGEVTDSEANYILAISREIAGEVAPLC